MTKIAYLAPEIPSVSCTFVYNEILALEEQTEVEVLPYSLHHVPRENVAQEARAFFERTRVVYGSAAQVLLGALRFFLRHPLRALMTTRVALRDLLLGASSKRWKVLFQLCAGLALARELRARGAQHLHVHFAHSPATVGMYAAHAVGVPFSITAHANDIYVHSELLAEKLRRARAFVTISDANRSFLIQQYGALAERVRVVRCGVRVEEFADGAGRAREPIVFSVGRLVPKKGHDVLLRAMAWQASTTRCVIAGDGPELPELTALARELGIEDRVLFLGAVPSAEVHAWLGRSRVLALACRRAPGGDVDGIPVALMEAMAAGVPVVSTRVSGVPELVDGQTGLLVEPEQVAELAEALNRLLSPGELAAQLARRGRLKVEQEYDLRRNALCLLALFQIEAPGSDGCLEAGQEPTPGGSIPDAEALSPTAAAAGTQRASSLSMKKNTERDPGAASRVVVITPARNEGALLPGLIQSMIAQTHRPARWVIVDDGSTDDTLEVARRAAESHSWIEVLHREDRGARVLGGGVIETFDAGLQSVATGWDFVAKVDADLTFGPRYIERALERFAEQPRLGALSGKVYRMDGDKCVEEFMIDEMVAGQWKLYRRECFEQIGGFVRAVMWDGIDFHQARRRGWLTRSVEDSEMRILHHRLMGSSDRGIYRGRLRWGRGQWFLGSHPLYVLASSSFRMLERPRLIGGALILAGYVQAAFQRRPRFEEPGFRTDLHRWQLGRLKRLAAGGVR